MKYIIVLGDGMADEPIGELGGRTPLQAADTPAMDWLAAHGRCGLLKTVPDGYHPGSEIANLWRPRPGVRGSRLVGSGEYGSRYRVGRDGDAL